VYDEVFNGINVLVCTLFYRITRILVYVNIIHVIVTIYIIVHVSTCVGHLRGTIKRNEVFGYLLYVSGSC
jgi:hypothetical protein